MTTAEFPDSDDVEERARHCDTQPRGAGAVRRWLAMLGPGLTAGASNNDPSAIATYASAGAALGFSVLWAVPVLLPMMCAVVYICAKIGMVSGEGLAAGIRARFPRPVLWGVLAGLVVANTFNAGADLGAISEGVRLLVPAAPRAAVLVMVAALLLGLQIWGSYRTITGIFKWLTFALLAFIAAGLLARPDWVAVLRGTVVPTVRFDEIHIGTLVAMIGTTLSPYLYFWQTRQRVEEELCLGRRRLWQRRGATDDELEYAAKDVNIGMTFGAVIIYFIILATAATLHAAGRTSVESAADAARALEPAAGRLAGALFAIGFIGSGLLAVPVLITGASYAVAEAFEWKSGLDSRPVTAPQFYTTLVVLSVAAVLLNFTPMPPVKALVIAAVINGVLAPPVLVLVMLLARRRSMTGPRTLVMPVALLGWVTVAATMIGAVALVVTML